ncbi:MW1434 family type I TA system toxin [Lactobacillus acetotolerans]|uniref:Thoeris anti-defense Tad2 family protein n=1 Tax=Lactobacillus acetotolerans TaxID=1600 RepID=UPI0007607801|nr:MW1434 family type I TA system toxin [Lactobacillus acetotolerans]
MKIDEAIILAKQKGLGIARKSWMPKPITIIPTNTSNCCLIISSNREKITSRWEPSASDLIANDWKVLG